MRRAETSFEQWLDRTFGRAVSGEWYPEFVQSDVTECPDPIADQTALEHLTRLFENPVEAFRHFSDRQIAAGLWELGPGDAHCIYNSEIPIEDRERLIGSVETFFREFFDPRCSPISTANIPSP